MLVLIASFLLSADDAKTYSVVEPSTLKYTLIHKAHTVVGIANKGIEGKARVTGGTAQLMVRVPVGNFDSENSNRDAHMKETVEAAKFPNVELKALGEGITAGQTTTATLKGKLTFHGVTNDVTVPVTIAWKEKTAKVTGKLSISLEAFKVERPSLLLVKVEDKLDIDIDLLIKE